MAQADDTEQEPSIEEILTSIRQIISDDEEEASNDEVTEEVAEEPAPEPEAEPEPVEEPDPIPEDPVEEPEPLPTPEPPPEPEPEPPPPPPEPEPEPEEEVIELTEPAEDESIIDEEPSDMEIEMKDHIEEEVEEPGIEDPAPVEPAPEPEPPPPSPEPIIEEPELDSDTEALLSKKAEDAAFKAFSQLAEKTAIDRMGTVTIEDIVRDEIRPMLKNWLDHNLPPLVQRLVKEELDRVARRAIDD